jgi:hypothetical protein
MFFIKYNIIFVPHQPAHVDDLRKRNKGSVVGITPERLRHAWEESIYTWDICRATPGIQVHL